LIARPEVKVLSLREKFQRWYDIYSGQLKEEAKDKLAELINRVQS